MGRRSMKKLSSGEIEEIMRKYRPWVGLRSDKRYDRQALKRDLFPQRACGGEEDESMRMFDICVKQFTDSVVEFEETMFGEALRSWGFEKNDVITKLKRYDCLEKENELLRDSLKQIIDEKDAAVDSWHGFCSKCVWNGKQYLSDGKMDDRCKTCRENNKCNWQWRGVKEG